MITGGGASNFASNMTIEVVDERRQQQQQQLEQFSHKNPFVAPQMAASHRIFSASNGNEIPGRGKKLIDNDRDNEYQNHNGLPWYAGGASELDALASALQKQQFRNRSMSDTEATEFELKHLGRQLAIQQAETNPFSNTLQKTLSETYLEQYHWNRSRSGSQTWSFGRSLVRNGSNPSVNGKSNVSLNSDASDIDLKRAISCDSVNSDSSVVLADLEQTTPAITGMLCVGLQFDK